MMLTHRALVTRFPRTPGLLVHQHRTLSKQVSSLEANINQWQSLFSQTLSISGIEADLTKVQIKFLILAQINQHKITLIMLKTQLICVQNTLKYKYGY